MCCWIPKASYILKVSQEERGTRKKSANDDLCLRVAYVMPVTSLSLNK